MIWVSVAQPLFVVLAPSAAPRNVTVEALNQHHLELRWQPPPKEHWNGALLGYYVGYKITGSDEQFLWETVEIPTGLKNPKLVFWNLE